MVGLGEASQAIIFYSDSDIHHVGFWARDMAKQRRASDIDDAAIEFSKALPFMYAHLAGLCRRKFFLTSLVKLLIALTTLMNAVMFVKRVHLKQRIDAWS